MKRLQGLLLAAFALCLPLAGSLAQDYPSRSIRLIVPFPPAGATDIAARLVAGHLTKLWSQTVIVGNRTGASGVIGTETAARSAPDGYTILMGTFATNVMAHLLQANVPYSRDSFAPVSLLTSTPNILLANSAVPAQTLKDLVAYVKANPGKVLYGTTGIGSFPHFDTIEYMKATGTDMGHIPIKSGAAGALQAILTGDVQTSIINAATAGPQIKSGKIAPLAVINKARPPEYPDVPTMAEIGLPNIGTMQWIGLFATAGTPDGIVQKLHDATVGALDSEAVKTTFAKSVIFASASKSPADAKAWLDSEWTHWGKIISTSGVDPDKAE